MALQIGPTRVTTMRSTLYADGTNGMWLIFRSICSGIAEALPEVDIFELTLIAKQRDALSDDEAEKVPAEA